MLTMAQGNSYPSVLFILVRYMELGERGVQVSGFTHNFNIVHFFASSTKRKGKPAFKQPIWLAQKPRRVKVTMFGRKVHTSLWFLLCPYCCSWSGHGNPQREEWDSGFPLEQRTPATECKVIFDFWLRRRWDRQSLTEVPQLEKQNGAMAKSMDKKRMKKHIWKIQWYTPLLSGYVVGSRLSAFVALFYLTVKIN